MEILFASTNNTTTKAIGKRIQLEHDVDFGGLI